MKTLIAVILITVNCASPLIAQNAPPKNDASIAEMLRKLVEKAAAKHNAATTVPPIPGIVAGIQKFGQPLRIGAFGVRKWTQEPTIEIDDVVHIGSCTKSMTATLVGRLIDQGKLTFETTIGDGLPHLRDRIHSDYHDVTLIQLLTHTAGMPRDTIWSDFKDHSVDERRDFIIAKTLKNKPGKLPGSEYSYSNLGYCIAGRIAAYQAGTTWEKLIKQEVFDKLGMKTASFGPPGTKGEIDQPWGHFPFGKKLVARQHDNPSPLGPAGTVHLTVEDWAKFAMAHAGCCEGFLQQATLERLQDPTQVKTSQPSTYACGWIVVDRTWAKGKALTHSGSNTYWYATVWVAPNTQTAYFSVANVGIHQVVVETVDAAIGKLIQLDRVE